MFRLCLLCIVVILFGLASSVYSSDKASIQEILNRRIIDPDLPLSEVQEFTEARVPPMPEVTSVAEWEQHAERMRQQTLDRVVFRGEAAKWRRSKGQVEWLDTIQGGPGYRIKKLRYEALPGLWIPALLYEPTKLEGKVPVVLNVNGHDRANGKAALYKQIRCINQAKRGMLALNVEWLGMGQLNTPGQLRDTARCLAIWASLIRPPESRSGRSSAMFSPIGMRRFPVKQGRESADRCQVFKG